MALLATFFYNHMKILDPAQFCFAFYDFEPRIMLGVCLTSYVKANLKLKSNSSEILPVDCKFICASTPI